MIDSTPKQEPPYGLRMPPDLKERVRSAAATNNRSMNAEIVATLEEKYPKLSGVEHSLDRINKLIEACRTINADHIIQDVALDLEGLVSDALKKHQELSRLLGRLEDGKD